MTRFLALAVLALASCGPIESGPTAPGYEPDSDGIAILGSPLRIDFGRTEAGVVAAIERLEGASPVGAVTCAAGSGRAVSWRGGPTLFFFDGAFLGWQDEFGGAAGRVCDV